MIRRRMWACGALLGLALAGSALAAPAASAAAPADRLTLSVTPVAATGSGPQTVTLYCEPTGGGDHPDAKAACKDLIAADGYIKAIPPAMAACPLHVDPVYATADGVWRGRLVHYSERFTNSCFANVETGGHVFNF